MHDDVRETTTIRTSLIHRITRGPIPWWHTAVICDVTGGVDDAQLAEVGSLLPQIASSGFDAICVRPEHVDSVWGPTSPLPGFVEAAHDAGLKIIVRLPGSSIRRIDADFFDNHVAFDALVRRAQAALAAGADGIDLGSVAPRVEVVQSVIQAARLRAGISRLARVIQAEIAMFDDQPVLTASVSGINPEAIGHHLTEDWFHHLRDGSLRQAPWEASQIMDAAAASMAMHDPLGAVCPWYWSRARRTIAVAGDSLGDDGFSSWESGADTARHGAMTLFGLSLPGAAYVAFGQFGGGRLDEGEETTHRSWAANEEAAAQANVVASALRIRREREMGSGSLGVVSGLEWAGPGVSVHVCGGVTVVLNTDAEAVAVPGDHAPLLSSQPTMHGMDGSTVVPPSTCTWFVSAPVRPVQADYWD